MTVSTLTLRQTKGARLTTVEMDNNWLYCSDASNASFIQSGIATSSHRATRTAQDKMGEAGISAKDALNSSGTAVTGDGVVDDATGIGRATAALTSGLGAKFILVPPSVGYKVTTEIDITNKTYSELDFGNALVVGSSITSATTAGIRFKGVAFSRIRDIYYIGGTGLAKSIWFDADATYPSTHGIIDKVRVAGGVIAIQIGPDSSEQFSDFQVTDIYGTDAATGIKLTGVNTLSMLYGRVSAYLNTARGVHIEEGGGTITALQSGTNPVDVYIGHTDGTLGSNLSRFDILGGYSENGLAGSRFLDSAKCTDTNPFKEQIVFNGMRIVLLTSTNTTDAIRWRLNSDLIIRNSTIQHGTQLPVISVDHNTSYRAPRVLLENCVIDCNPTSSTQRPLLYSLTDNRQYVEINAQVNNAYTFWQNAGSSGAGTMKRGIYMSKLKLFEAALRSLSGLQGAWNLADLPAGTCKNLVVAGKTLALSAAMEAGDLQIDDGLVGLLGNGTTSKTLSSSDATFVAAAAYTFGCIMRSNSSGDTVDTTNVGGASAIRIGIGDSAGAFAQIRVGAKTATATPTNQYDPHLVIGRYTSATRIEINCKNLRTGEEVNANSTAAIPAFGALTWTNGISFGNTTTARAFPFLYNRVLSDVEVSMLEQSAELLTDSWRLS